MPNGFVVPEDKLQQLRATRSGRITYAGYNYQASYAIARMAAMLVRRPVLDLDDWPTRLRYDWGEDLDEVCGENFVFTQCKRIDSIRKPSILADILMGFAPKWLWAPQESRESVRFRLVCPDPSAVTGGGFAVCFDEQREATLKRFASEIESLGKRADGSKWSAEAHVYGLEQLFADIWDSADVVYLPASVHECPAGRLLYGEEQALSALLQHQEVAPEGQTQAVARLRRLLHDNLIRFDHNSDDEPELPDLGPRFFVQADVGAALFETRHAQGYLPFTVVDRTFLSEQAEQKKRQFVARFPDWADVVHGEDSDVKFVERTQTDDLRKEVVSQLVEPLEGADYGLHALFLIGPPGSGKSTLARRVAAQLVQEGRIVVADTRQAAPRADAEEYCRKLDELSRIGYPLLLLLDDPLCDESGWLDVLRILTEPDIRASVLAASPTLSYERYHRQLPKGVTVHDVPMKPPTEKEREALAAFYGRENLSRDDEDFLVLVMQAAEGMSFAEIAHRVWCTLNGGEFPDGELLADLDWRVRAYLFTCFFHRYDLPCHEPLLRRLIGGEHADERLEARLAQLKSDKGWELLRIQEPERCSLGLEYTTSHTLIAQECWERRPLDWLDVSPAVASASLDVPESVRTVGALAAMMAEDGDSSFAEELVARYEDAPQVETRYVCDLLAALQSGAIEYVAALEKTLRERAAPRPQGWLAALALHNASSENVHKCSFPRGLDIEGLIDSADFAVASDKAVEFADAVGEGLQQVIMLRLRQALVGGLDWRLDSGLLGWMVKQMSEEADRDYLPLIREWLERECSINGWHDYLTLAQKLGTAEDVAHALDETYVWIEQFEKEIDFSLTSKVGSQERIVRFLQRGQFNSVRARYLCLVQRLGTPSQVAAAIARAPVWLEKHPSAGDVREEYLQLVATHAEPDVMQSALEGTIRWVADVAAKRSMGYAHVATLITFPTLCDIIHERLTKQQTAALQGLVDELEQGGRVAFPTLRQALEDRAAVLDLEHEPG